jgi:hypothetical protein
MKLYIFTLLLFVFPNFAAAEGNSECGELFAMVTDPWSSSQLLVKTLEKRGIKTGAIISSPIPSWGQSTYYPGASGINVNYRGNKEDLIAKLKELDPQAVFVGADTDGITLTDYINENLGLPGNGTKLSIARRKKAATQLALASAGLDHIHGILTSSIDDALAFADKLGEFPLIVKPNDDGGSVNVFTVNSRQELVERFKTVLGAWNSGSNKANHEVLVQQYIQGTEYAVQGVGQKISSILKYEKIPLEGHGDLYLAEWILPPNSEEATSLVNYVRSANHALSMNIGPFHWEIKYPGSGKSPVAIELNARLAGSQLPLFFADCVGYNEVDLMIEQVFFPKEFERRPDIYSLDRYGMNFHLHTPGQGQQVRMAAIEEAQRLPGFKRVHIEPLGSPLPKTINLDTIPVIFEYVSEYEDDLRKAYDQHMRWKEQGFFFEPYQGQLRD